MMLVAAADVPAQFSRVMVSWRPVMAVLFPMLTAFAVYLTGKKSARGARIIAALAGVITFLLVLSLYPALQEGVLEYRFSEWMSIGLLFRVDLLGFIFAFLVSLAWMLVLIYAVSYLDMEKNELMYLTFSLLTLGSCLGVVLTGDLVSLFLFFELMTFSSFVLVINRLDKESVSAGLFTLYLGIAGGLVLLFGIFALYSAAGTVELAPLMEKIGEGKHLNLGLILTCFLVGFGIKAGMIPLHLWMPRAYTVSPAVVNALSSGAMIKAGIYGILRLLMLVFTPAHPGLSELFAFARSSGYAVMWLGLLTMVAGAGMALLQGNIMTLLAYSSISQMGYIITGLGAGAYLFGLEEAMGYSGAVLHAFNHTLFKTSFFLIAGIIYFKTGELEFKKLGGLAKRAPLLTGFFVLFVLAIAGVPGLNGYISKTLIHDALLEAHHYYHGWDLYLAEKVFLAGSALTLCYYLKFFLGVFTGRGPRDAIKRPVSRLLYLPLFILAVLIIAVGLAPNVVVETFILPSAATFTFDAHSIKHLIGFHFFAAHPLESAALVLLLAGILFLPLRKLNFLEGKVPRGLSIEYLLFAPLAKGIYRLLRRFGCGLDAWVNKAYLFMGKDFLQVCRYVGTFDSGLDNFYAKSSKSALHLVEKSKQFDDALNEAYERTGHTARDIADRTTRLDGALNKAYEVTGSAAKRMADKTARFDEVLNQTYEQTGKAARELANRTGKLEQIQTGEAGPSGAVPEKDGDAGQKAPQKKRFLNYPAWNIRNINFDSLLLALVLGLVIFLLFYFSRGLLTS